MSSTRVRPNNKDGDTHDTIPNVVIIELDLKDPPINHPDELQLEFKRHDADFVKVSFRDSKRKEHSYGFVRLAKQAVSKVNESVRHFTVYEMRALERVFGVEIIFGDRAKEACTNCPNVGRRTASGQPLRFFCKDSIG